MTGVIADPNRLEFAYSTDIPCAAIHKDTTPPSRLTDGQWTDPAKHSVQYESDVNLIADLGASQDVRKVRLMVFRRQQTASTGGGFDVERVTVSLSNDQQKWRQVAVVENDQPWESMAALSASAVGNARYVKLFVEKPAAMQRMLLGEIEIIGPEKTKVVAEDRPASPPPRPMHVKKTLDDALLEAGVQYLYSCYATDVLRDAAGQPCGIVMANRAGRQAVVAKTIIDATPRATARALAGATFRPYPGGTHAFRRVVIGGEPKETDYITARQAAPPFRGAVSEPGRTSSGVFQIIEYTMPLPIDDDSYAAYMRADQQARTLTYHPEQQFTSDVLFEVPPDAMHGREAAAGPWQGADQTPLAAFQPADVAQLYVLGGCADVSREQAESLLRPLALIDLGARVGKRRPTKRRLCRRPRGRECPASRRKARRRRRRARGAGRRPAHPRAADRPAGVRERAGAGPLRRGRDRRRHRQARRPASPPPGRAPRRWWSSTCTAWAAWAPWAPSPATTGATASASPPRCRTAETLGHRTEDGMVAAGTARGRRRHLVRRDRLRGLRGGQPSERRGRGHALGRGVVLAKAVIDATGNADVAAAAGAECHLHRRQRVRHAGHRLCPAADSATPTTTPTSRSSTRPTWSTSGTCSSTPRTSTPTPSTRAS